MKDYSIRMIFRGYEPIFGAENEIISLSGTVKYLDVIAGAQWIVLVSMPRINNHCHL